MRSSLSCGLPASTTHSILSSERPVLIAGEANPELLEEYVALEERIGHDFQHGAPIREIRDALARGERGLPHPITPLTIGGKAA